jgi:hypothetical protein
MLECKLYYENSFSEADYKPIQDAILAGKDWADICEEFDDWLVTDEATVDLTIKMGWNVDEYIHNNLDEMIQEYIEYDGVSTTSVRRLLVNDALYHIYDCLDIPYEPLDD